MFTNADITLYHFNPDYQGYERKVILSVFWSDTKQSNLIKSGMTDVIAAKVLIPAESIESPLLVSTGKDLILKGICLFEFDNTSQRTISESIKQLREMQERVLTINSIDEKLYGSPSMRHYKLGCK